MRCRCYPIVLALVIVALVAGCATPKGTPTAQPESQPRAEEATAVPSVTPTLEPTLASPSPTPTVKPTTAPPSATPPRTIVPPSPTRREDVDYPPPTEQQASGYPSPAQQETATPSRPTGDYKALTPTPHTPMPGTGVVTGVMTRHIRGLPLQAIAKTKLFLAKMVTDAGDPVALARLSESDAPSTLTNDSGQFAFVDVEPGKYALIVKTAISPVLAHDVVTEQDVLVDVAAGEVAELGDIHVSIAF